MKLKAALAVLVIAVLLASCQPTPEKPVVVNKADGKLEETIQSTPALAKPVTEETAWKEQYDIPGLNCKIDAELILPDTNIFPVYKVKQREFDAESADKIVRYFTKESTGVRETSDTKEELSDQLIAAKEDDNGARWEPYEGQKQRIAELERQIKNAPEEVFGSVGDKVNAIPFNNTYYLPSGLRMHISARESCITMTTEKYGVLQGESWLKDGGAIPGEPAGATIEDIKISKEEALDKVNALV